MVHLFVFKQIHDVSMHQFNRKTGFRNDDLERLLDQLVIRLGGDDHMKSEFLEKCSPERKLLIEQDQGSGYTNGGPAVLWLLLEIPHQIR